MANFLTVAKIKSSQKQNRDLDKLYGTEQYKIENALYELKIDARRYERRLDMLTEVEAARYCVNNSCLANTYSAKPFYAFIIDANNLREAINVTNDVTELITYLQNNMGNDHSKEYYAAVDGVLAKINKAIKNKTLIGYTYNSELANKFATFKYSLNMDIADLENGWKAGITASRRDILDEILGADTTSVLPLSILNNIIGSRNPFNTLDWRLARYSAENKMKIDPNVYKLIEKFPQLQHVLKNGDNLQGLELSTRVSITTILMAVEAGEEYLNELRTADGWVNAEQMQAKWDEHNEIFSKAYEALKSQTQTHPQYSQAQQNYDAMTEQNKQQEKLVLQQKIISLEAQINNLEAQWQVINGQYMAISRASQERVALDNQMRAIKSQKDKLRSELDWTKRQLSWLK